MICNSIISKRLKSVGYRITGLLWIVFSNLLTWSLWIRLRMSSTSNLDPAF
ncbi:unnamed protein product [Brassica napus]|uniref:(rape) hypothetical protein n=1 Tax=Brassica napus TaxID=3708 RepID=A0A816IXP5_BRANA|nr:unnamed protein product [Brassica napus]